MGMERLKKQIDFLIEIDKIKHIIRRNYLADGTRRENDAEHSWHLGMMVFILSEYFEGIDVLKTVKMVIMHDLVEIIAGDVYCYDEKANLGKFEREQEAANELFSILPEDQKKELYDLWIEFEERKTPEAVCAAILDRLQPLLLNYTSGGKSWLEHSIHAESVKIRNEVVFEKADKRISDFVAKMIEGAREKGFLK
jgi:putative hydrolase of HD superfamily